MRRRGSTPLDASQQKILATKWKRVMEAELALTRASDDLNNYLTALDERGVPLSSIAGHLGVTRNAVVYRVKRVQL